MKVGGIRMKSEVTVLIPFFNSKRYLRESILSVLKQTYQKWKLILIDDCSTDNYFLGIKDLLKDPRIKLIQLNTNLGQSRALNRS